MNADMRPNPRPFCWLTTAAAAAVLLAACGTSTRSVTARTKEVRGENVIHVPVLADLEVGSSRVSATVTLDKVTLQAAKAFAVSEALKQANADVLVDPVFTSQHIQRPFLQRTVVTVTGYPAHYRDFRSMTPADTVLMKSWPQTLSTQGASEFEGSAEKGSKLGRIILPVVAIAAVVLSLVL